MPAKYDPLYRDIEVALAGAWARERHRRPDDRSRRPLSACRGSGPALAKAPPLDSAIARIVDTLAKQCAAEDHVEALRRAARDLPRAA